MSWAICFLYVTITNLNSINSQKMLMKLNGCSLYVLLAIISFTSESNKSVNFLRLFLVSVSLDKESSLRYVSCLIILLRWFVVCSFVTPLWWTFIVIIVALVVNWLFTSFDSYMKDYLKTKLELIISGCSRIICHIEYICHIKPER